MPEINIHVGDCLEWLDSLPEHSLDSCVTDPPYHLTSIVKRFARGAPVKPETGVWARKAAGFMGQEWDGGDIAFRVETWEKVYRALKPGAHLLASSGDRTYHRMTCAIEDAGFEIRGMLEWVYSTGFPKSLDVSKAIDKMAGVERVIDGRHNHVPSGVPIAGNNGRCVSCGLHRGGQMGNFRCDKAGIPVTDQAHQWNGWGSALKPAHEPIVLARVPLEESSIARQVLATGTGALNVDGCRVGAGDEYTENRVTQGINTARTSYAPASIRRTFEPSKEGRYPPNLILSHGSTPDGYDACADGCPEGCSVREFGDAARFFPVFRLQAKPSKAERERGCSSLAKRKRSRVNPGGLENDPRWAPVERGNDHATVKPVGLMRWLVRLVTPPGGTVLEPFLGSGTTGMACVLEGVGMEACELIERHATIARARIDWTREHGDVDEKPAEQIAGQGTLFEG